MSMNFICYNYINLYILSKKNENNFMYWMAFLSFMEKKLGNKS